MIGEGKDEVIQQSPQLLGSHGLLEFLQRPGLDLADAFTADGKDPADVGQGVGMTVGQPVTQADHFPLAIGEGLQGVGDSRRNDSR